MKQAGGRPKGSKAAISGQRFAQKILMQANTEKLWADLIESEDERIKLDALKYLSDRAYGKAVQPHAGEDGQGPIQLKMTVEYIGAR